MDIQQRPENISKTVDFNHTHCIHLLQHTSPQTLFISPSVFMPLARRWMSSEEEEKSCVLLTPRRSQPSVVGVRQLQPFRVVWLFSDQYFSVIIRDLSGIHALNARRRPLRRGVFVLNLSPSEEPEAVQRADW